MVQFAELGEVPEEPTELVSVEYKMLFPRDEVDSAEETFIKLVREDFQRFRDGTAKSGSRMLAGDSADTMELVASTEEPE